jgi:hypothetical protein
MEAHVPSDVAGQDRQPVAPIVFYGEHTASLSLYLDGLGPDLANKIAILPPSDLTKDFRHLSAAGLVVYVRGFEHVVRSGLDDALERLGVPRAWFTDDDLIALHGEQPGFQYYNRERVGRFANRMLALVGTTPAMCERLGSFHATVLHWPCVLDEALVPAAAAARSPPPRVGVVGGDFRRSGLRELVMPAIEGMPDAELIVAQPISSGISRATVLPFEPEFRRFIDAWRVAGPNILAHPPGRSGNIAVKGAGTLLASLYLGAVPVVADEPAFAGLGRPEGVIRVAADVAQWRAAFLELSDPEARARHFGSLAAYCRTAFPANGPRQTIDLLLARTAPLGPAAQARLQTSQRMAWRPKLSYRAAAITRTMLSSIQSQ